MEQIKLFEGRDMNNLELKVNEFLSGLGPSIKVTDISYQGMLSTAGLSKTYHDRWTAMVRYEIEMYDDKPVFQASNSEQLAKAVSKFEGKVEAPYVVKLPDGLEVIEENAFEYDDTVGVVIIPDSVKVINTAAFSACKNLSAVKIPDSVVWIGVGAFADCQSLNNIILPKSLKRIRRNSFAGSALYSIFLPDTVKLIEPNAFYQCHNLSVISIPDSVVKIGECAFEDCTNLKEIYITKPELLKGTCISKDIEIITPSDYPDVEDDWSNSDE